MVYSRKELLESIKDAKKTEIITRRYFNKYKIPGNEYSKEFKRLKWHELDFIFQQMSLFNDEDGKPSFNLMEIPEARYYVLCRIILTYNTGNREIDFEQNTFDCRGEISRERKMEHQSFFHRCLEEWFQEFEKKKGDYYSILYPMYKKKEKELVELKKQKCIDEHTYRCRSTYTKACFFHIYYTVKLYFDGYKNVKADVEYINRFHMFADIYTYSHVLCRHYYPNMNKGLGPTMNGKIDAVDIRNLPHSLLDLVVKSSEYLKLDKDKQYILYVINGNRYILWIKYGFFGRHNNQEGFEIRSFYKCSEQRDLEKYDGTIEVKITDDIFLCVNES